LFLVPLRFVPSSRFALGRRVDSGALFKRDGQYALMNDGIAI
jgi:hypothetical protein